jgi:hypothetical protein
MPVLSSADEDDNFEDSPRVEAAKAAPAPAASSGRPAPAAATPASPSKLTRVPTWLLDGGEDEADRERAGIALRALQSADAALAQDAGQKEVLARTASGKDLHLELGAEIRSTLVLTAPAEPPSRAAVDFDSDEDNMPPDDFESDDEDASPAAERIPSSDDNPPSDVDNVPSDSEGSSSPVAGSAAPRPGQAPPVDTDSDPYNTDFEESQE